jgi:hypothetical protein
MLSACANPRSAAFVGFIFALPFVFLNAVVANRIEPLFSFIRPGVHTSPLEYVLLCVVLMLFPLGAYVAIRPMTRKSVDGKRHFFILNGVVAAFLLVVFVLITVGLGLDVYRCDILGIPNAD